MEITVEDNGLEEISISIGKPLEGGSSSIVRYRDENTKNSVSTGGGTSCSSSHYGKPLWNVTYKTLLWDVDITEPSIIEEAKKYPKEQWLDVLLPLIVNALADNNKITEVMLCTMNLVRKTAFHDGENHKLREIKNVLQIF